MHFDYVIGQMYYVILEKNGRFIFFEKKFESNGCFLYLLYMIS